MKSALVLPARSKPALCIICRSRAAQLRAVHRSASKPQQAYAAVRRDRPDDPETHVDQTGGLRPAPISKDNSWGHWDSSAGRAEAQTWTTADAGISRDGTLSRGEQLMRRGLEEADRPGRGWNSTRSEGLKSLPYSPALQPRRREQSFRRITASGTQGPQQNVQQQSNAEPKRSPAEYRPLVRRMMVHRGDTPERNLPTDSDSRAMARCYNCGEVGHRAFECPQKSQERRPAFGMNSLREGAFTPLINGRTSETLPNSTTRQVDGSSTVPPGLETFDSEGPASTRYGRSRDETKSRHRDRFIDDAETSDGSRTSAARDYRADRRKPRNLQYARDAALLDDDAQGKAERRRQKELKRQQRESVQAAKQVVIPDFISIGHLASLLNIRSQQFERSLKRLGFSEVNHDYVLNAENASLIALEYDFEPITNQSERGQDLTAAPELEDKSALDQRPPVVTIMGHVDHGKTTILDYLRKSSIAASEYGGITQHIGAFRVPIASGKIITFLDTPGHSAFLSMRQRGANVTDIVVLVVAADDGVMPQTIESIKCARSANVPIIVAINKMDKEEAHPERIKSELARHGVEVEDFGGDTQVVYVSGKTGSGMETLEEAISTLSEILDQRAEKTGAVEGWVLEASTQRSGRVATVLIRRGTLRVGDIVAAGKTWARVRTLKNEFGANIDEVGPGVPAEVEGWRDQPAAGDEVLQASDEQHASDVIDYRMRMAEQLRAAKDIEDVNTARRLEAERRTAEASLAQDTNATVNVPKPSVTVAPTSKGIQEVYFAVKGDVSGSVEAVINSVAALGNNEIRPIILLSGVGQINESDVERAALANGLIIAFNVNTEPGIRSQADKANVQLIEQNIIYRLVEDVKALLESRLPPEIVAKVTGEAEIAQPFSISITRKKSMLIAGSRVKNGVISLRSKARVIRGKDVIHTGVISSLKNRKLDAKEMRKGAECGIAFEGWEGFEIGDQIQCFEEERRKRTL